MLFHLIDRVGRLRPAALLPTALAVLLACAPRPAAAQTDYLVGASLYSATSTGASANTSYLYDLNTNNTAVFALSLTLNGTTYLKGSVIPLALGANNFTINTSPNGVVDPGSFSGVELFFSNSPTSYDPTGTARTPDIVLATGVALGSASGNFTPAAGAAVASYIYPGTTSANGLSAFTLGSTSLSESNLLVTHSATGSFTINESNGTAPEPTTFALAALGIGPSGLLLVRGRRRR